MPLTIDTCVCVSAFIPQEIHYHSASHILKQVFAGEHYLYMPYPGLTEIICKVSNVLIGHGKAPEPARKLGDMLLASPCIVWVPIDKAFAYDAALFGQKHRLRGMDAIYAYTALKFNCELLTGDGDFFKSANREIKIRHLGEMI